MKISVGIGGFVIGLGQISFFFSVEILVLQSFVRHQSDGIRGFVRLNKILSDGTFFHKA